MTDKLTALPTQGVVFWPVGTGDSTTIAISDEKVIQVDIHHMSDADEDDDPHTTIVERLVSLLPTMDDKPYLSTFVLTHPDQDHCCGFTELLKRVTIGELWFTPRIFREYSKDLCDDAKAFRKEAKRRVQKVIENDGDVDSGDRVRIIGYDDLLKEEQYEGFPRGLLTIPGNIIVDVDGQDVSSIFRAFVHAPFKDDSSGIRNNTSVALQITLYGEGEPGRVLLLGDHCYPTTRMIFDRSEDEDLLWNVMLAAHHCSKGVMYWQDSDQEEAALRQDILDDMEKAAGQPGYIVASCEPIPASNSPGDNPPHAKAKRRYEEIAPDGFLCTQEYPDTEAPEPIVFELAESGLVLAEEEDGRAAAGMSLAQAVAAARGTNEPPHGRTGYGRKA